MGSKAILVNLCPNVSVLPGVEVINLGLFAPATLLDLSYPFVTSGLYMSGLNLISRSFQCEFSWFLNPLIVFDSITFAGKLFQVSTTLRETVFSNISSTLLLVDCMLVASGWCSHFSERFYCYLPYLYC
jgi:hypothetical protein